MGEWFGSGHGWDGRVDEGLDCPLGAAGLCRPQWLLHCRYPWLLDAVQRDEGPIPLHEHSGTVRPSVRSLVGSGFRLSRVGAPLYCW